MARRVRASKSLIKQRYHVAKVAFPDDADLARSLGVHRSAVVRWKRGEAPAPANWEQLVGLDTVVSLLEGFLEVASIAKWPSPTMPTWRAASACTAAPWSGGSGAKRRRRRTGSNSSAWTRSCRYWRAFWKSRQSPSGLPRRCRPGAQPRRAPQRRGPVEAGRSAGAGELGATRRLGHGRVVTGGLSGRRVDRQVS